MEFLVKLQDKINPKVFCLNPVHKGMHMDRVSFEDDTFAALCPVCSSPEFLYRKNNTITKKGHFVTFKEDGWNWGINERKHYGIARIECDEKQARQWCQPIQDEQAIADVRLFRKDYKKRFNQLLEQWLAEQTSLPTAFKENKKIAMKRLKADTELLQILEKERQAENKIWIAHRSRKWAFDFESILSAEQLNNWLDQDVFSDVIILTEANKSKIKKISWH